MTPESGGAEGILFSSLCVCKLCKAVGKTKEPGVQSDTHTQQNCNRAKEQNLSVNSSSLHHTESAANQEPGRNLCKRSELVVEIVRTTAFDSLLKPKSRLSMFARVVVIVLYDVL